MVMSKENFVTKKYFNKMLGGHSKVILEAVNAGFEGVNGQLSENKKERKKLEEKIDKSWKAIDGYVKAQENFKEEFVVMKGEMKHVKHTLKDKLGVEVRAI